MEMHLTEGIVLHSNPFQERYQIVTLFTAESGLCKLFCPYSLSKRSPFFGCFSPIHQVEVSWENTEKDLPKLVSASLLSTHHFLRTSIEVLESSCGLLNALTSSQMPYKPARLLYDLLMSYLHLLPLAKSPEAILASFQLKILRHEGLLACDTWDIELQEEEKSLIQILAFTTSSNLLKELSIPPMLTPKIKNIFHDYLTH